MKVFVLNQSDFDRLIDKIEIDPGNRTYVNDADRVIYGEALRKYNYIIREWISSVTRDSDGRDR